MVRKMFGAVGVVVVVMAGALTLSIRPPSEVVGVVAPSEFGNVLNFLISPAKVVTALTLLCFVSFVIDSMSLRCTSCTC